MIRANNATKRFDDITAVDHICAEVQNASVYGLIGSNGAGKSTFLRMLAGILEPDEGEVWIDGEKIFENTAVKSLFAEDVAERGLTPVIASHNLRELEDICDHVGLLHRGGILFSRDLDEMKLGMYKVQCIFGAPLPEDAWNGFDLLKKEQRGSLYTITARGERDELIAKINKMNPTFCELLPLTLEEIFINETEVAGYDVKKLLF